MNGLDVLKQKLALMEEELPPLPGDKCIGTGADEITPAKNSMHNRMHVEASGPAPGGQLLAASSQAFKPPPQSQCLGSGLTD